MSESRQDAQSGGLTPEDAAHCSTVISYIEDMTEWYDADVEDATRLEYALRVLAEIDGMGRLGLDELRWCQARLQELYGDA